MRSARWALNVQRDFGFPSRRARWWRVESLQGIQAGDPQGVQERIVIRGARCNVYVAGLLRNSRDKSRFVDGAVPLDAAARQVDSDLDR
jgi:hypothetical protein